MCSVKMFKSDVKNLNNYGMLMHNVFSCQSLLFFVCFEYIRILFIDAYDSHAAYRMDDEIK